VITGRPSAGLGGATIATVEAGVGGVSPVLGPCNVGWGLVPGEDVGRGVVEQPPMESTLTTSMSRTYCGRTGKTF